MRQGNGEINIRCQTRDRQEGKSQEAILQHWLIPLSGSHDSSCYISGFNFGSLGSRDLTRSKIAEISRDRVWESKKAGKLVYSSISTYLAFPSMSAISNTDHNTYDAIIIGSGIGGLVTATQLAAKGAKVLVLERYLIPGGSAGYFDREGYRFDVGASMIFGFGKEGTTNLLTRALAAVNRQIETIPDPVQIHYHLPDNLEVKVHQEYEDFLTELSSKFPHEAAGIRKFYDECWRVFNCLNVMDLLSLEEIRYLTRIFFQHPAACLGLVKYLPLNAGDIARKYISDPILLKFIDIECYCWSVVPADMTPMINAGMVFSDRHYGGINYPVGGVGKIAQELAAGLESAGGKIQYQARVTQIITEGGKAVGVELANGKSYRARRIVSNATRWDTFEKLLPQNRCPLQNENGNNATKNLPVSSVSI